MTVKFSVIRLKVDENYSEHLRIAVNGFEHGLAYVELFELADLAGNRPGAP